MYKIQPYTYQQAEKLGVVIKPSQKRGKKIDVFNKHGDLIVSVGDINYKDYPTYLKEEGKEFADKRRALYKTRHAKDINVHGSAGFYADKLLW